MTAEDCVASIKRWGAKDATGQKLMTFVAGFEVKDAKTFVIKLKEPTGLVLLGLGKPSSTVPFMMPKRVAETDPNTQISDFTGSGPFVFKRDEWKPGDKTVYVKFDKYKPRSEPASGLAGGKVVQGRPRGVARHLRPPAGDERAARPARSSTSRRPSTTCCRCLKGDSNIKLWDYNPLGNQYTFRPNWLHKPFDNPKVRQALWYAFNQKDFLDAVIGDPNYYKTVQSHVRVRHTAGLREGHGRLSWQSNFKKAQELLKEAGYDGTPIVLMHSTDLDVLTNLAPVAKSLMEKAGLQGRHAVDGLADGRCAPCQEGSTQCRWLARLPHLLGGRRHHQSDLHRLPELGVRQGHVRLALRYRDGKAA